ncbi:hypothetical protein DSO57_1005729 [Entomophthora muscae]|uniref:Uncharacterized protein n=1 Tax=Entomophthora muscae TaxID=34485 RepID=A0ACC2T7T5_9FUNG|nr:hypothetical protein DSO57_1005729 [Entomophthora muscae]
MCIREKDNRSLTVRLATWDAIGHVLCLVLFIALALIPYFSHVGFYVLAAFHALVAPISFWLMWEVKKATYIAVKKYYYFYMFYPVYPLEMILILYFMAQTTRSRCVRYSDTNFFCENIYAIFGVYLVILIPLNIYNWVI